MLRVFVTLVRPDAFMAGIEAITSDVKLIKQTSPNGTVRTFRVRIWNPTVANLTLMALGSSTPEILLSVIELVFSTKCPYCTGDLGAGTIVGSAAYNLFIIIAVCVVAVPATEGRRIQHPYVYMITAFFSVFAYLWLIIVLVGFSPNVIDITEAIITFLLFPFTVWLAYKADRWATDPKFRFKWRARLGMVSVEEKTAKQFEVLQSGVLLDAKKPDGTPLDLEELLDMVKQLRRSNGSLTMGDEKAVTAVYHQYHQLSAQHPKSSAFYRINATRAVTGVKTHPVTPSRKMSSKVAAVTPEKELVTIKPGHSVVEFPAASYAIVKGAGKVTVHVLRDGDVSKEVTIEYATVDGTDIGGAGASDRANYYESVSAGILTFAPGQTAQDITIRIFDDDEFENNETFTIELKGIVAGDASLGSMRSTRITIINDAFPGTFHLTEEDIVVKASCGMCKLTVERVFGCSGAVSMTYTTIDASALAGKDYTKVEGKLEWAHHDVEPKTIEIPILHLDNLVKKVYFEVEIGGATGGAIFDEQTDGNKEKSLARITITDDDAVKNIADSVIAMLGLNHVTMRLGASSWREQFTSAFEVGGGNDEEEGCVTEEGGTPGKKGAYAYVMMIICLPWNLIVAIVPPANILGGYPCFFVAILLLAVQTAIICDFASLSGCAMGVKDEVVAFTLVAMGTSLPDTFASISAARSDTTADAAIGNVTGSNAVNVFLGLGISWVIGAFYWSINGVTEDWLAIYGDTIVKPYAAKGITMKVGDSVGLAVPAGSLSFSVLIFCIEAAVAIGILAWRRYSFGNELGMKYRWTTVGLFVILYFVYCGLSTLVSYAVI